MLKTDSDPLGGPGRVVHEIRNYLQFLSTLGCSGFDCSPEAIEKTQEWGKGRRFRIETIDSIEKMAKDCRCCHLSASRRQVVFGSGDPKAGLMLIGDYPDLEDEEQGLPFVGKAGDLLTKIIHAMGFTRENIYLCNVIKCSLPGKREPVQEEVNACLSLLHRQIQSVQPDIICTLGEVSTHAVLNTTEPLSALRGRFHPYSIINVMPTYHPALLLTDESKKRDVWEDMKLVMKEYHKRIPRID
ncbi:MAG: uracil-DNA glycosylase [Desulfobacterium sp.]|nr:uracil-DNA glycosylase [Desulfobacterium sp.]